MGMLELQDLVAWPEGMNLQAKPWAIEPTQARYLQDILLDKEEVAYMRGPIIPGTNPTFPTFATKAIGIVSTQDPNDIWRIGVLTGDSTHAYLQALNTAYTSATQLTFDVGGTLFFKDTKDYRYATSPYMKGGVLIGTQPWGEKRTQTGLAHWGGAAKNAYSTGTVSVSQDSTSVTSSGAAFTGNIEAGMFLYAVVDIATAKGKQYIGQGDSFTNTTITLVEGALFAVTARSYVVKPIRPLDRRVSKGQVTCTGSGTVVNGSGTKFKRQGLDSGGPWAMFRADDMKYIGKVDTVESDIQLHLTSNANVTCNKEEFVAIDLTGDRSVNVGNANDFGFITAYHANRQWYANNPYSSRNMPHNESRVQFSRYFDPEAVDRTADGDHIFIPNSTPPLHSITGLWSTPSCLLVTKQNETWGIFGSSEADFAPRKLHYDGAFSPMTFQEWNGGVLWAGEKGIWFFDGNEVYPMIDDRIGDWYQRAVENTAANTYPAYSMLYKNCYILFIPDADPPYAPDTSANDDNSSSGGSTNYLTICLQLDRRAVSVLTNLAFMGGVKSTLEESQGTVFVVNHYDTTTPFAFNAAKLCRASDLFNDNLGPDTINTSHNAMTAGDHRGPTIFVESGRYDMNSPQVKKRVKQLMGNFWIESVAGDYIESGTNTADIGHSTADGSAVDLALDIKAASKITLSSAPSVTTAKIYLDGAGSGSGSQVCKAVLYEDSAGSPGDKIATSAEVTVTDGQAAGWVTFTFSEQALAAGSYWLSIHGGGNTNTIRIYRTAGSNYVYKTDTYADGASDPFGTPDGSLSFELNGTLQAAVGVSDYNNNYLNFATIVGLNDVAVTSNGKWRVTRVKNTQGNWVAGFQNRRVKFNKKTQFLGFKIWPSATNTGFQKIVFGAMALAFKSKRPGQV